MSTEQPNLPDFETFQGLLSSHGTVAVSRGLSADWLTPATAFPMIGGRVLLESAEGERDRDRYSFIAFDPIGTVKLHHDRMTCEFFGRTLLDEEIGDRDPLDILKQFQTEQILPVHPAPVPVPAGGIGYLAYEIIQRFEKIRLRDKDDPLDLPELLFQFHGGFVVFDRLTQSQRLVIQAFRENPDTRGDAAAEYARVNARLDELESKLLETQPTVSPRRGSPSRSGSIRFEVSRRHFINAVNAIKEQIVAGEILQGVIAQGLQATWLESGFEAYRRLRSINPSPYLFFLAFDDFDLFGASPEVMVRLRDGKLLLKPIAGTRRRPDDPLREPIVAEELLNDEKEKAEHLMLVDLGRNDLGRIAKTGSVLVTRQMFIEKFSHVFHMVSEVQADLEDGMDAFDAIRATFPAGTVSGAPKLRAMEIVDEVEPMVRGPYAGLVGYFDGLGNFDSCITIRSAVRKDNVLHVRVGAGVVYDSIAEREFDETIHKAGALLAAIGGAVPNNPGQPASPAGSDPAAG